MESGSGERRGETENVFKPKSTTLFISSVGPIVKGFVDLSGKGGTDDNSWRKRLL